MNTPPIYEYRTHPNFRTVLVDASWELYDIRKTSGVADVYMLTFRRLFLPDPLGQLKSLKSEAVSHATGNDLGAMDCVDTPDVTNPPNQSELQSGGGE